VAAQSRRTSNGANRERKSRIDQSLPWESEAAPDRLSRHRAAYFARGRGGDSGVIGIVRPRGPRRPQLRPVWNERPSTVDGQVGLGPRIGRVRPARGVWTPCAKPCCDTVLPIGAAAASKSRPGRLCETSSLGFAPTLTSGCAQSTPSRFSEGRGRWGGDPSWGCPPSPRSCLPLAAVRVAAGIRNLSLC